MHQNNLIPVGAVAVTPSNSTQLSLVGLYVGGTGDVTVLGADGNSALFSACPVGTIIPMAISQVKSTGTTATLLTGFIA